MYPFLYQLFKKAMHILIIFLIHENNQIDYLSDVNIPYQGTGLQSWHSNGERIYFHIHSYLLIYIHSLNSFLQSKLAISRGLCFSDISQSIHLYI